MSLLSRRPQSFAAPEPQPEAVEPLASVPTTEAPVPAEPLDPTETAALALAAASADFTAAQAAVAAAREALEATTPASFATADAYVAALDRARFAVAKSAELANYAAAKKEAAKAEADRLARAELVEAAAHYHDGCAWAGAALVAATTKQPDGYPVTSLVNAVKLCKQAVSDREDLASELGKAGLVPAKAPPDSIASDLPGLLDYRETGLVSVYLTAVNVARWVATEPARIAERRETNRRRDLERARHQAMEDASGRNGPEAQAKAITAEMNGVRAMSQPRTPTLASEPAELRRFTENARLQGAV